MPEKPSCSYSQPQSVDKGLISIFTGDGKGKTTAAIGTAIRAAGHGFRVFIAFFAKGDEYYRGEANALSRLSNITVTSCQRKGWIDKGNITAGDIELAKSMLAAAREAMLSGDYNLIILDEINIATNYGLVNLEDVVEFINDKPQNVELILTGRYAKPELVQMADLVTEMNAVKHPFNKGIKAHRGIDY